MKKRIAIIPLIVLCLSSCTAPIYVGGGSSAGIDKEMPANHQNAVTPDKKITDVNNEDRVGRFGSGPSTYKKIRMAVEQGDEKSALWILNKAHPKNGNQAEMVFRQMDIYSRRVASGHLDEFARLAGRVILSNAGMTRYWNDHILWNGVMVLQSHEIHDLYRTTVPEHISFPTTQIGSHVFYDRTASPIQDEAFGNSRDLMTAGIPGVGPDGRPIQVCRVFKRGAVYIEVDQKTLSKFSQGLGQPGIQAQCESLPNPDIYWKARLNSMTDRHGLFAKPQGYWSINGLTEK